MFIWSLMQCDDNEDDNSNNKNFITDFHIDYYLLFATAFKTKNFIHYSR
jgi:hypothetical protein